MFKSLLYWLGVLFFILFVHFGISYLSIDTIIKDKISLLYLLIIFLAGLTIIGGKKGVKTILTLIFTILIIFQVLLPMILNGYNPIAVSIIASSLVIIVTLLIISGVNKKTLSAIIGTTGGVTIAGFLALIVGYMADLSGLGNEESIHLILFTRDIDFKGLLFAGIIIGSMGAVMDVGMSISSAMQEIAIANPQITTEKLIAAGMNIGRDIMGTMANTLILAYVGASLNLMLFLTVYEPSLVQILVKDNINSEIVRSLAGSIGLIFTVPITAVVSGFLRNRKFCLPMSNYIMAKENDEAPSLKKG